MSDATDIILAAIFDAADMSRRCADYLSVADEAQFCEDQLQGIQATINAMRDHGWLTIGQWCELSRLMSECRNLASAAAARNALPRLAA